MTDNEIIKALECCRDDTCVNCPICIDDLCDGGLHKNTLDLIYRQKAEIERLTDELHRAKVEISNFFEQADSCCNEAIDVFADSLKIKLNRTIDNLVKEMTEENENDRA